MSPVKPIKSSRTNAVSSRDESLQLSKNHTAFASRQPTPHANNCYYQTNPLYYFLISLSRPHSKRLSDPLLPNSLLRAPKNTLQNMRNSASIALRTVDSSAETGIATLTPRRDYHSAPYHTNRADGHAYHSSCRRARRRNNGRPHRRALRQRGSAASLGHRRPRPAHRNAAALKGIENALKGRPGAFYRLSAALVKPGNFEDHSDQPPATGSSKPSSRICRSSAPSRQSGSVRKPDAIVSTNTSGIPLAQIAEGFEANSAQHFLGTHFFNPPRYLHLVEFIPGARHHARGARHRRRLRDRRLGKGVVPSKDTPNFIANRIGSFFGATIHSDRRPGPHDRRSRPAHRPADRPAQKRQLSPARHRRPGRLGPCRRQSL